MKSISYEERSFHDAERRVWVIRSRF
jgi:hypothetical protein